MRRFLCWLFGVRPLMKVRYWHSITVDGQTIEFGCQTAEEMDAYMRGYLENQTAPRLLKYPE